MTETLDRKARESSLETGKSADLSEPPRENLNRDNETTGSAGVPVARRVAIGVTALAIVAAGVIGAATLIRTKPRMARTPPAGPARVLVQAENVRADDVIATVHAMGTVVAAREIELRPQVSGEVAELHPAFVPGGILGEGDGILRIDSRDYNLAVVRQKAQLAQAESALVLEQGRRDVAEREWELVQGGRGESENELDRSLAMREPHMQRAQAVVDAAQAAVDEALLGLERTRVAAPFNCVVASRYVNLGSQVSPQVSIARLVGTDEFWVRVSVPVDRIDWIRFPDAAGSDGSAVRILYGPSDAPVRRDGRVYRLLSDLETAGRMAQVLVSVRDPLGTEGGSGRERQAPLLLGDFVRVEIDGRLLEDVVRLPRTALRDNDTVWVISPDDTLDVRDVRIAWREPESVLVADGLADGDRVIVSSIGTPVPGLAVRTANGTEEDVPDGDEAEPGDSAA